MEGSVEEEADEVAKVAVADAGPHPRTVVVVHFNAKATVGTVVGSGRPHDLARVAVGEHLCQGRVKCLVYSDLETTEAEVGFNGA